MKSQINMLCSSISHMALLYVWEKSGVTQRHGFEMSVDSAGVQLPGRPAVGMRERAPKLLDGTYDFLSGLHHETYVYRAKGDKRFMYMAQAQNDWDDRLLVRPGINSPQDLEGKKLIATTTAPCVLGNLKHALEVGGADLSKIDFVISKGTRVDTEESLQAVQRGEADAVSVDLPFDLRGEKMGLEVLDIPHVPVIHNATMCANREWVLENEETTVAFLRSMIDAIHFFKTQKSKTCQILEENLAPVIRLKGSDEVEHLQEGWADLLSPKPYPHPLAVWNVYNLDVAHDPNVNFIGPFEIWDTSYLRSIDDAGYIEELYGGAVEAANPVVNPVI